MKGIIRLKIGIFGGAFDPVHIGHTMVARSFIDDIGPDMLIIIPTSIPPHRSNSAVASAEDRINMLRLVFDNFTNTYITDIEFKRPGKSYSYDTICFLKEKLTAKFPDEKIELYLIIGADEFMIFDTWYRYKDILNDVIIYTFCRENVVEDDLEKFSKNKLGRCNYIVSSAPSVHSSSSEIRSNIMNGRDYSKFLDCNVYKYIERKGLYGV